MTLGVCLSLLSFSTFLTFPTFLTFRNYPDIPTIPEIHIIIQISSRFWFRKGLILDGGVWVFRGLEIWPKFAGDFGDFEL